MASLVIITLAVCAVLIAVVLTKPFVNVKGKSLPIYWAVPAAGAILIIALGYITPSEAVAALFCEGSINPIKILILFISMTLMSVFLDEAGFFAQVAELVLSHSGTNQKKMFIYLYAVVSVLTVFTSNDIIVLTFTPFICFFAKNAKIDPMPFLFCEFVAANTWSMLLIIGNPTNIYLASSAGISFTDYTRVMLLPTVLAGGASFAALWLIFRKRLSKPIDKLEAALSSGVKTDRKTVAIGLFHLGSCIVLLTASSYTSIPMWIISLIFAISLYAVSTVYFALTKKDASVIKNSLSRSPLEIIPFVISMFVIISALEKNGVTALAASLLGDGIASYGISSFLFANIINNIPMSVLFSSIIPDVAESATKLYSAVIGSNIGAFLTPIGALAGIMWSGMLRDHGVKFSFGRFAKYGVEIAIPSLAFALIGLSAVL